MNGWWRVCKWKHSSSCVAHLRLKTVRHIWSACRDWILHHVNKDSWGMVVFDIWYMVSQWLTHFFCRSHVTFCRIYQCVYHTIHDNYCQSYPRISSQGFIKLYMLKPLSYLFIALWHYGHMCLYMCNNCVYIYILSLLSLGEQNTNQYKSNTLWRIYIYIHSICVQILCSIYHSMCWQCIIMSHTSVLVKQHGNMYQLLCSLLAPYFSHTSLL